MATGKLPQSVNLSSCRGASSCKMDNGSGEKMSGHSTVLVLDFGSQYTQLIARRVREMGVLSKLLPGDVSMVSGVKKWRGGTV